MRNLSSPVRTSVAVLVTVLFLFASACTPEEIQAVIRIKQSEEAQRRETQLHPFLVCVRHHESDRGSYPHTRGYGAQNPKSTASGAYQFLDSTWHGASARAGYPGYSRAKAAPWWVQDAVALHVYRTGGRSAWNGSGC